MKGLIYIHKNKINGKCYVGQTVTDPKTRWGKNGSKYWDSPKFWNAIQKYGWNNFEHIILPTIYTTQYDLDEAEIYHIKELNSVKNGYNLREGGNGGGKASDETRLKMSLSKKGKPNLACKGVPISEDHRQAISKANLGNKWNLGRIESDETRRKKSLSHKGLRAYTDGTKTKRFKEGMQPDGWVLGLSPDRLKTIRENNKKLNQERIGKFHWYTDYNTSGFYEEGKQPDGWVLGRKIKKSV